jgi:hypothetical protein
MQAIEYGLWRLPDKLIVHGLYNFYIPANLLILLNYFLYVINDYFIPCTTILIFFPAYQNIYW